MTELASILVAMSLDHDATATRATDRVLGRVGIDVLMDGAQLTEEELLLLCRAVALHAVALVLHEVRAAGDAVDVARASAEGAP